MEYQHQDMNCVIFFRIVKISHSVFKGAVAACNRTKSDGIHPRAENLITLEKRTKKRQSISESMVFFQ